jgi:hypothetical protein
MAMNEIDAPVPAPAPMTIMEHIYSGLTALRAHLSGNDAALHAQVVRQLNGFSPAAHAAVFADDHDHVAAAQPARDAAAVQAVLNSQLSDHVAAIEAAPRTVNPTPAVTDEDRAAHLAQMQPGAAPEGAKDAPAEANGEPAEAEPEENDAV